MGEKDVSRWDLNLSGLKFSSKINSSAGIFEKPKKNAKNSWLCPLWASLEPVEINREINRVHPHT